MVTSLPNQIELPGTEAPKPEKNMDLMGSFYDEADPINLCRAICIVYDRWIASGRKPGSDNLLNCTRTHRPQLVAEIAEEWERLASVDHDDDLFPYHESYVIRKWVDFRKMPDPRKQAWIAAAKNGG